MFKTLLRKQLLELNKFYFQNRKTGELRSKASVIKTIALFVFIMLFLALTFVAVCLGLVSGFHSAGVDWMYFLTVSALSVLLGAFGSVFNTYASLYKASDNDLLLSLPIKPGAIICSRLVGVFLMGLMYEASVIVPGIIVYWVKAEFNPLQALLQIGMVFVIAVLILVLSIALGYIVALLSTKIKSKAVISVLTSVAAVGVYYFCYFKAQAIIKDMIANADKYGENIKSSAAFLYNFSNAFLGDARSFVLALLFALALLVTSYFVLRLSFIKLATRSLSSKRKKKGSLSYKPHSVIKTFERKEIKRFFTSPAYMMNTGLGFLIMPVTAIAALVKSDMLLTLLDGMGESLPQAHRLGFVFAAAVVCLFCSLCCVTAPSISLEGKSFYLLKSLPIMPDTVLLAKLNAHTVLNAVPAVFAAALLCIVLKSDVLSLVICIAFVLLFIRFVGAVGLYMNLKDCNLEWTNEVVPVKQGKSVLLTIVFSMTFALVYGVANLFLAEYIDVRITSSLLVVICGAADFALVKGLKSSGARLFNEI